MALPKHQLLPIAKIELDKTNPRIQFALETYGTDITAERIALALIEGSDDKSGATDSYNRLRNSILKHRSIVNPIVVNYLNGEYVCVEGNTRVQIYRDFQKRDEKGDWSEIPVLLYEDASLETTESIRLQAHVIGPRPWTPYAKARYLTRLYDEKFLTYDQIVEYCGGRKSDVDRSIKAFRMAEEVYRPILKDPIKDFREEVFSGFVEYQKPRVQESVLAADFEDKDFCSWLHKRKFNRLEHVRYLPQILDSKKAKEVFLKEGSRAALNYVTPEKSEENLADKKLIDLLHAVTMKISRLTYEEIQNMKINHDEMVDTLESTQADVDWMIGELRGDS